MPTITDERIFERIKQHDLSRLYFLYGNENYFINSCVDKLTSAVVAPDFVSFNLNRFDGSNKLSLDALEQACDALPMMADKRLVLIKDADIDKMPKDDFDRLLSLCASCAELESLVIVIYNCELTYDVKKSARLKKLCGIIDKLGTVCEFSFKDKSTLKRALCSKAKKEGIELSMPTADLLIERCSQSYALLITELTKLCFYAKGLGSSVILPEYIDSCSIPSIDSTSFDLAKSILRKQYDVAFKLLDELFYQRIEALAILGALNMCFLDLYRVRCAVATGRDAATVVADFSYPANRKFAVTNAFRDVQGTSVVTIRRCIESLMRADITLKSSKLSDRLVLEQMIGYMI